MPLRLAPCILLSRGSHLDGKLLPYGTLRESAEKNDGVAGMRVFTGIAIVAALGLTGCKEVQGGQVAASVNGDEITLQEINAELRSMSGQVSIDPDDAPREAVQRIIKRRLMAQRAEEEGLDRTPAFLMQSGNCAMPCWRR